MSAVSSTNTSTGLADLMQMLSSSSTPAFSSLLSSSTVQAALAKAPAKDIVHLSEQAVQLQEVDGLFGAPAASTTESSGMAVQDLLTSVYTGKSVNLVG
jgi:hypothetical protein